MDNGFEDGFKKDSNPFMNGGTPDRQEMPGDRRPKLDSFDNIFNGEQSKKDVPVASHDSIPDWSEDPFAVPNSFPESNQQTTPGDSFQDAFSN